MLAGMAAGAVHGGLTGGISGAVRGAAFGGLMGAGMGVGTQVFGPSFAIAALGASAAYTGATQGWEGLGYMAGGIFGGVAGYQLGTSIGQNNIILSETGQSGQAAGPYDPKLSIKQNCIKKLYEEGRFQEAVDTVYEAYDLKYGKGIAKYNPDLPSGTQGLTAGNKSGVTKLEVGPGAFLNPKTGGLDSSRLVGTIYHEGVHVTQFEGGNIWNLSRPGAEIQAYSLTLQHARSLELSPDVQNYYRSRILDYKAQLK